MPSTCRCCSYIPPRATRRYTTDPLPCRRTYNIHPSRFRDTATCATNTRPSRNRQRSDSRTRSPSPYSRYTLAPCRTCRRAIARNMTSMDRQPHTDHSPDTIRRARASPRPTGYNPKSSAPRYKSRRAVTESCSSVDNMYPWASSNTDWYERRTGVARSLPLKGGM